MSSYYDDPDFADIYRERDEEALIAYLEELEAEDEAKRKRMMENV